MTDPVNAEDDLERMVQRLYAYDVPNSGSRDGQEFLDEVAAALEAVRSTRDGEIERLKLALWLFREFVIRNATQWEAGAGHHHPIWAMIAEQANEMGGIVSGPYFEFIQPENRQALNQGTPNVG